MSPFRLSIIFVALLAVLTGTARADDPDKGTQLDAAVPRILAKYHTAGAGIAVLRDGRIAWSGYYGDQAPGIAAGKHTMFNGASLAKTITAETTLRLASQGRISLDEPIWPYYVHPALANDPRYKLLTPRIILSHRSGLLNWSYVYPDGKLAFVAAPGARFGYSGIAFEILGRFLEKRLGASFEDIVHDTVFAPLGLTEIAVARHDWMNDHLTTPMDSSGHWKPSYRTDAPPDPDHPIRAWSAAADLFTSVEDYARFFVAVMHDDGLTAEVASARRQIYSPFAGDDDWACAPSLTPDCPREYGFGLGWMIFRYDHNSVVTNGGNDSGENALVYFTPEKPGNGVVVFMNGGGINSVRAELEIIDTIDPEQKLTAYYRQLIAHHLATAKK